MSFIIKKYTNQYNREVKKLLLDILENEFGHYNIDRPDLDNIIEYYKTGKGNFWIALNQNELIGTIGLKDYDGIAYIKRMAVKREYRGKGIAQELLSTLTKYAEFNKYSEIYLSTSQNLVAANKFYLKEGFKVIDNLPKQIPPQIAQINYVKSIN